MKYKMLGAKIAYYRHIKGFTQLELASSVGVSSGYISKIERGIGTLGVPLSMYMRIAQALDVTVTDLMKD